MSGDAVERREPMTYERGPHYAGNCPFKIVCGDPDSAKESINRCVNCVTENTRLKTLKKDFYQIAMLTVLEETPKYDPNHPSGASYTTYIKTRVCTRLWWERKKELRFIPFPLDEQPCDDDDNTCRSNPLVAGLISEACSCEALEDEVIRLLEVESFCAYLPKIMAKLTDKERRALEMKYFEDWSGIQIAEALGITKGRVSQIIKSALVKVEKAYRLALESGFDNL